MSFDTIRDVFLVLDKVQKKNQSIYVNIPTLGYSCADDNWDSHLIILAKVFSAIHKNNENVPIFIQQMTRFKSEQPFPNSSKEFFPLKKKCCVVVSKTGIHKLSSSELEKAQSIDYATGEPLPERKDYLYQDVDVFLDQC